jgi:hypothetical protein
MANDFKNTTLVIKKAMKHFLNALVLGDRIDRQLDTDKVFSGKVGATAYVRRPVYFAATDGAVIEAGETSDIEEGTVPVTVNVRKKVVFSVTSADMTLKIEDAEERYIKPAMQELAQKFESEIADAYKQIANFTGTPGTSPGTFLSVANASAKLDLLGVPDDGDRNGFYGPTETVTLADGLKAVFPQDISKKAIIEAAVGRYAGFNLFKCQSLKLHTVGVLGGTPAVNAASSATTYLLAKDTWTQDLVTDGWTAAALARVAIGDVFNIAGVNSVNRRTREDTGELQDFVARAVGTSDGSGNMTLSISPPIITSGAYKTVASDPANSALLTFKGTASTSYRQNLLFHKNAITAAMVQLDTPEDGATSYRQNFKGCSIRVVKQYNDTTDETRMRFDIFFGLKAQNPGMAIRHTS